MAAQADKEEDAAREKRLAALEAHIAEDAASDAERERLMAEQAERIRAMDAHIEADKQADAERERKLAELERYVAEDSAADAEREARLRALEQRHNAAQEAVQLAKQRAALSEARVSDLEAQVKVSGGDTAAVEREKQALLEEKAALAVQLAAAVRGSEHSIAQHASLSGLSLSCVVGTGGGQGDPGEDKSRSGGSARGGEAPGRAA